MKRVHRALRGVSGLASIKENVPCLVLHHAPAFPVTSGARSLYYADTSAQASVGKIVQRGTVRHAQISGTLAWTFSK